MFVTNADEFFLSYRLPLARAEQKRGAEVFVIAPETGAGARIEAAGFTYLPLQMSRRGVHPLAEARTVRGLQRLYRRLQPDLVHHVTIKPVLYGSFAARAAGVPATINAVSGLGYVFTRATAARRLRPLVQAGYRAALRRRNTFTVFENHDDRDAFLKRGLVTNAGSTVVPGLGVDLSRFRVTRPPPGTPVLLLAGRLLWDKGLAEFVEAARIIRDSGVKARFCVAGIPDPGNPRTVTAAQMQQWVASGLIEWWGHRDDMPAVYREASVVVAPTRYREGVPRVLLEGAASARPLVASDMPGCREIVRPGRNGMLVLPGDAPALADALRSLLKDPAERQRLGAAGRKLVEAEFCQDAVIERFLGLHSQLLAPGPPPEIAAPVPLAAGSAAGD